VKVRNLSIPQRDFILNMAGVLTAILFFISGVGSYRIFIVYAIEETLKGSKIIHRTVIFGVLAYIFSAYWDFKSGPIIFPSTKNYFPLVFFAFVIVRLLIQKSFKRLISDITQNQYFETCPSCHYHNSYLVGSCANCDYKKGDRLPSPAKISINAKGDIIPATLTNLLTLGEGEEILFHKTLTVFTNKFKNGKRIIRKHLVITSRNLIILDYNTFQMGTPKGWTARDLIPLSEIVAVEGKLKKFYMNWRPFLIIRSNNDVYEIALSTFAKYVAHIDDLSTIIKTLNPQVVTANSLIGNDAVYSSRDKRLLLLLPFLLILLGMAIWRLIQYMQIHGFNEVKF
jgi:hypothetical protein